MTVTKMRVYTRDFVLITAVILTAVLAPRAYGEEIPDLIIRNVNIIGTGSQTKYTLANIQIVLNILLDTQQFVRFAIVDGQLVVNKLQQVLGEPDDPGATPEQRHWLSCQPPPFAIPTSVEASGKWNVFKTMHINGLFYSALALDRQRISQDAERLIWRAASGAKRQPGRLGRLGTRAAFLQHRSHRR